MFKNPHDSGRSSARAGHRTPRWRRAFMALLLVVAIGSAGQILPAQAAPLDATNVTFSLAAHIFGGSNEVCVGELVPIEVRVFRLETEPGQLGSEDDIVELTGVGVFGVTNDTHIGYLSPNKATTSMTSAIFPAAADFIFHAENPGQTILSFQGVVSTPGWMGPNLGSVPMQLKDRLLVLVKSCKFDVTTIGQWQVPGPAHIFMAATSGDAEVKAPDAHSPFTGSTSVDWAVQAGSVGDCSGTVTMGSSQVDWTGQMDDSGQLSLNGTYKQATGSENMKCGGASQSRSINLTPDPIKVSVASSGGVFQETNVVQGPEATSGSMTIVVVPVEDKAASFVPGAYALSWIDFPTWLGAQQLAFH